MSSKIHLFFSFFLFFYIADAFNITKILSQYKDFSTFNSYLTQTGLVGDINSRRTITILAVANDKMSSLSAKSSSVLKSIMSVHVVLDYYDLKKLQNIKNKTDGLTTLFQTSGQARAGQGFLNVTHSGSDVKIVSTVQGSNSEASLEGTVTSQPYNISVLQISNVIVPKGIDNATYTPTPSPKAAKAPRPAKSPSPRKSHHKSPPSPSPSPSDADSPAADSPTADNSPSSGIRLHLSLEAALLLVVSSAMWLVMV